MFLTYSQSLRVYIQQTLESKERGGDVVPAFQFVLVWTQQGPTLIFGGKNSVVISSSKHARSQIHRSHEGMEPFGQVLMGTQAVT
jgi:hypothetical protein